MPRFEKHYGLIAFLFGEDVAERYAWVHKWKDEPCLVLGVKHRAVRHSILDDILLAMQTNDPMVAVVGILHDIQDMVSTELKKQRR